MLPADERLEPDDPAVVEVDDRLVVAAQLAAHERGSQVVLEVDPLEHRRAHRRLEQQQPVGRVLLGADHRDLRLAEQLLGRHAVRVPDGDRRSTH